MTNQVINVILKFGAPHFQLLDLLVGCEINFLFDAVNGVIEAVVFVEHLSKVIVSAFQPADDFAIFRKLPKDWMMKVHDDGSCW